MSDTWQTTSGLTTNYDGVVEEAMFGTDARVRDGKAWMLFLKIRPTDGTEVNTDDGLLEERFTVGDKWSSEDGGETITGAKKIHQSSRYGRLIDRVVSIAGGVEQAAKLFNGEPTTKASIWVGFHAHWDEEKWSGTIDGKAQSSTYNLPSKILDGAGAGPGKATASKGPDMDKVAKLAKAMEYGEWVNACMGLTGADSDDTFVARLADEGWYNELKAS